MFGEGKLLWISCCNHAKSVTTYTTIGFCREVHAEVGLKNETRASTNIAAGIVGFRGTSTQPTIPAIYNLSRHH
jgi:hypothetical protein